MPQTFLDYSKPRFTFDTRPTVWHDAMLMNRREDLEIGYDVRNGFIRSPGKFEGCPAYALHYWDMSMNGMADETDDCDGVLVDVFDVTEDDRKLYPEIGEDAHAIRLWEDDYGFVHAVEMHRKKGER